MGFERKFTGTDDDLLVLAKEGKSTRAIAAQVGLSKSVVAARMARARKAEAALAELRAKEARERQARLTWAKRNDPAMHRELTDSGMKPELAERGGRTASDQRAALDAAHAEVHAEQRQRLARAPIRDLGEEASADLAFQRFIGTPSAEIEAMARGQKPHPEPPLLRGERPSRDLRAAARPAGPSRRGHLHAADASRAGRVLRHPPAGLGGA